MGLYDRDYMKEKARTERERAGMGWNTKSQADPDWSKIALWCSLAVNVLLVIALVR